MSTIRKQRLKEIIKLLLPPIVISLYSWFKNKGKDKYFSGVYNSIDEIRDENPWIQRQWIEHSRRKLESEGKVSSTGFMPTSILEGYPVLPCLITNLLSKTRLCHVMDFAGGTGFIYFRILPYLLYPENVIWHVQENNAQLLEIGRQHALSMNCANNLVFHTGIPKKSDLPLDILLINASLQYIHDYFSLLDTLLQFGPTYVILTRLLIGDMKTYITCQNIYGYKTPCVFTNFEELVGIFEKNGYELVFKSPIPDEVYDGKFADNIPKHLHIRNASNLIFKRSELKGK